MGPSSVLVSPLAFITDMVAIYIGKVARFLEIKVTVASFKSLKSLIDGIRLMESRLLEGLILIKDHASFFFKGGLYFIIILFIICIIWHSDSIS